MKTKGKQGNPWGDFIRVIKRGNEKELRAVTLPGPETAEQVSEAINILAKRTHNYGTCVYAMSISATLAFYYMAHALGTTGFQASCADMDILRRTRSFDWGRIVDYSNLVYPQYCNEQHFPSIGTLLRENRVELGKRAKKLLATRESAAPAVIAHWKGLVAAAKAKP